MHNQINSNSFAASVRRNLASILSGFDRLQRIEYAAPWRPASATVQRPDASPAARLDARPIGLALIASLATLGVTLSAMPTSAHAAERHRTATVQSADLNLASSAGLATLETRIAAAAKRLCRLPGDSLPLYRSKATDCEAKAIAAAQPQVRLAVARQRQVQFADRAD